LSDLPEDDPGMRPKDDRDADEIPRQGIFSAIPKRTFSRVLLLLAALAAILYLRQRTSSIASCMSDAFRVPPPAQEKQASPTIKGRVVLPSRSAEGTP
jgi:hypothetical protein